MPTAKQNDTKAFMPTAKQNDTKGNNMLLISLASHLRKSQDYHK